MRSPKKRLEFYRGPFRVVGVVGVRFLSATAVLALVSLVADQRLHAFRRVPSHPFVGPPAVSKSCRRGPRKGLP